MKTAKCGERSAYKHCVVYARKILYVCFDRFLNMEWDVLMCPLENIFVSKELQQNC